MGVVASIVSTAFGVYSSMQQANAAEDAARQSEALAMENARLEEKEGMRQMELADDEQQRAEAALRARQGASGVASVGSPDIFKEDVERQHDENLEWMRDATKSRSNIIRQGGAMARAEGEAKASGILAGGLGSAFGGIGDIYEGGQAKGWWG